MQKTEFCSFPASDARIQGLGGSPSSFQATTSMKLLEKNASKECPLNSRKTKKSEYKIKGLKAKKCCCTYPLLPSIINSYYKAVSLT